MAEQNLIHDVLSQSSQMTDMCNQHIMLDALEEEKRSWKGERERRELEKSHDIKFE